MPTEASASARPPSDNASAIQELFADGVLAAPVSPRHRLADNRYRVGTIHLHHRKCAPSQKTDAHRVKVIGGYNVEVRLGHLVRGWLSFERYAGYRDTP